ncbi:MAG: GNAT family N-acetyltransferase [Solirubrobacterales bacterium]|nr:GNAT family N-acetyltransferase [Solirubrobacterales bacterium]
MDIRPIEAGDSPALSSFFERIPESDRTFLKEDVGDARVLDDWVQPGIGRTIALDEGLVVGALAVVPLVGWSSHVGEVRLVVDPDHRGRGIGRRLARQAVLDAVDMGLGKLVVEVIADQGALIAMFRGLGFEPEALLTDHVRDRSGQTRDLIVLANSVDEQFAALSAAGVADQLH